MDEGRNVTRNKNSWNNVANVLFLDQPVGVGYSYADGGEGVNNTPAAAEDVYAFLMLFISQVSLVFAECAIAKQKCLQGGTGRHGFTIGRRLSGRHELRSEPRLEDP